MMGKDSAGTVCSRVLRRLVVLTGAVGLWSTAASASPKTAVDDRIALESRVEVVRKALHQAARNPDDPLHPLMSQWNNWNNWNNWVNGWSNWGNWLNR